MKKIIFGGLVSMMPMFAFAQGITSINGVFNFIESILSKLVPLFISIAVVYFIWGVLGYVLAGGDEEKRKAARDTIIYGIIAIFVMVSVWGLVNILVGTFGLNNTIPVQNPILRF